MLKWIFTLIVAVALLGALGPVLDRLGLGRLPGDVSFRRAGRVWRLPFTSTLVATVLLSLIFWSLG